MNIDRDVPAIFFALLQDLKRKPYSETTRAAMTEPEWTRWLALADHLGRWYWDLPGVPAMDDISQDVAIDAMTEATADAISDSVTALEQVATELAASIAELRAMRAQPAVSEPAPDIPIPFPPPTVAEIVEALHVVDESSDWREMGPALDRAVELARPLVTTEPTPSNGVAAFLEEPFGPAVETAPGKPRSDGSDAEAYLATAGPAAAVPAPTSATARVAKPASAPLSPREVCEPGCGRDLPAEALSRHRAGCPEWLAYRKAHVRDVTDPDWPKPLPADDEPEREAAFVARRTEAAGKKSGQTWAERHPGETQPLTEQQAEIMAAIRASGGNIEAANRALGLKVGISHASVSQLRSKGRLPDDVAALLEARKAERAARS